MSDNIFNCDKCGITCQNQTALTNHKISEKTVNCGLCFKTFKNLCELYFIHSTNGACALLPVSCDTCNKRFASVAYMQKHKETSCDQSKQTPYNNETLEVSKVVEGTKQDIEDIEQDIEDIENDIELIDAVRKDDNLNTLQSSLEENLDEISKSIKQEIHEEGGFIIKEEPLDPSYEDQTEFQSWIQNTYPKLYTEYCQTSTPTISSILPSITICAICNLGYITSFHFGINCCKKDLQFIQDTFINNRIYTECVRMCPPKKSTWCKYCRLRKCLISGMDISLVQKNAHYGVNDQVWEDEKIESNFSVENEDVMDAEVWLKNVYPVIYVEYARQSPGIARKQKTLDDICTICSLRPNHRDWFGIRCCQSDDTFLRTTFSKRLPYQICSKLCPPQMVDWCSYCRLQSCISAGVKVSGMQLNGSDLIKAKISRSKIVRPSEAAFQNVPNVPIVNARNDYMLVNIEKKNNDVEKMQEHNTNEINSPILALEEEQEKSELEKWIKEAYPKIYQEYEREKRYPQSTIALSPPPSVYNFLRMIFSDQLIYDECENMCPMTLGKLFCGYCRVRRSLKAGINLSLVDTENDKSSSIVSKAPITNAPTARESTNYPIVRQKPDSVSYSMKVQDSMSYPMVPRDPLQISKYDGEPTSETADAVSWVRRNYPLIYEDYLRREEVNFTDNPQICPICYLRPHSGLHYGIYCCEGDKQFLKRTFHEQIVYEICPVRCAPKPRGWCQYCRLRECLKSGVDLNLIRVSEARRRKQMKQKKDSFHSRPGNKRIKYEGDLGSGQLGLPFQAIDSVQQAQQFQVPWQMQSNSAFPQFYMQQNILVQNNIMSAGQDTVMDSSQVKEAARRGIYFKCNKCEHVATTDTNLKRHVNAVHGVFNSGPPITNNDSYSSIMF